MPGMFLWLNRTISLWSPSPTWPRSSCLQHFHFSTSPLQKMRVSPDETFLSRISRAFFFLSFPSLGLGFNFEVPVQKQFGVFFSVFSRKSLAFLNFFFLFWLQLCYGNGSQRDRSLTLILLETLLSSLRRFYPFPFRSSLLCTFIYRHFFLMEVCVSFCRWKILS